MLHHLLRGNLMDPLWNSWKLYAEIKNDPRISIMPNHCCIFISNIWMLVECTFQVVKQISNFLFIIRAVDREVLALFWAVRLGASLTTGGPQHIWHAVFFTTKLARWELPWWMYDSLNMLKRGSDRLRSICLEERWRNNKPNK